ncbi:enoyl-ACP reductase FabV [Reinekea marinisedimentorum]|uniref:Enoyl-[acyl-carrier-protein] reductase [NADH] n=1 Tax=Reinekea marinisedimentorum TaxID=230495 RepID=A0A4V6NY45_9GAMM|nr:enoyl-ACP reductase FabV [Reinekea marinisedimentorum]TCS42476.1 enoyl-[acyl-carrier protein] reductase/trans-2-enoyl-CoA reductase (NAD+) [Reinekea marinisedimentorum]
MVIKPKIRGFICTTAHPVGCAQNVQEQIEYVKANKTELEGPKNVLVIGCSNGYGLASRITAAFGFKANTLGVMFEKEPTERRTASAGWYNTAAFEKAAKAEGLYAESLNADAFSNEAKEEAIAKIKENMGTVDLVVYSLGAPRRKDPNTGEVYSSTLKPIGEAVTRKNLNTDSREVSEITLEPANDDEIFNTVKVMGGEDWEMWMDALAEAGVLAEGVKTTAYTYIGKDLTWPIYGGATIGKAKEDLDRAAKAISEKLESSLKGKGYVSVLKALVTQSSSAIPVMPLYISALYKVMKENGTHEGCIEQIFGLFYKEMYADGTMNLDDSGRIRMEDNELDEGVQSKVAEIWSQVNSDNLDELTDFAGYQNEFYRLFGFGYDSVDYDADVDPIV